MIPDKLKKLREELANENYVLRVSHDAFEAGFDTACAELLPMIDELMKALGNYAEGVCHECWAEQGWTEEKRMKLPNTGDARDAVEALANAKEKLGMK